MLKTKTGVANFIFIQILIVLSLENRFCSRKLLSVLLLKPLAYLVAYAIERNVDCEIRKKQIKRTKEHYETKTKQAKEQ